MQSMALERLSSGVYTPTYIYLTEQITYDL